METFLQQIYGLLVEPPGNLVYHLVLVFATLAALQAVSLLDIPANHVAARRMRTGLVIILATQVLLFGASALGWQNLIDVRVVLPPLDRAVIAFTLLWVAWIILFPAPNRMADWIFSLLTLALAGFLAFSLMDWSRVVGQIPYNSTSIEFNWATIFLAISLLGGVLTAFLRPPNLGSGLGFFILVFAGSVLHLTNPYSGGDYAGPLRLALICAFPLLPGMARSLREVRQISTPVEQTAMQPASISLRAARTWAELLGISDRQQALSTWVKALGLSLAAEKAFYISFQDAGGPLPIQHGWDLVEDEPLKLPNFKPGTLPIIENALAAKKTILLQFSDSKAKPELETITKLINSGSVHNVLFAAAPLAGVPQGGILMIAPTGMAWSHEEAIALENMCRNTTKFIDNFQVRSVSAEQLKQLEKSLEEARNEVKEVREEQRLLLEELDSIRFDQDSSELKVDMESLMAVQRETQLTIAALEAENEQLKQKLKDSALASTAEEIQYLEQELRASLEETAHLQNMLAETNIRIMDLERAGGKNRQIVEETRQAIIKTVQKMNPSVSAIIAYTSFLENELAGNPEDVAHSYLNHLRHSADQLKAYINEILASEGQMIGPAEAPRHPATIEMLIDQAVGMISPLLAENNVNLVVDLPEPVSPIYADEDAIQPIVIGLLQNAAAVTPFKGTIHLNTRIDDSNPEQRYLVIQVSDEGGGISPDEIGKVFNEEYRAQHPRIKGISDSVNGLITVRKLVEVYNGRIWVETAQGGTSTYSVLLPLESHP